MIYICIIKTEATDACTNSQQNELRKMNIDFILLIL